MMEEVVKKKSKAGRPPKPKILFEAFGIEGQGDRRWMPVKYIIDRNSGKLVETIPLLKTPTARTNAILSLEQFLLKWRQGGLENHIVSDK